MNWIELKKGIDEGIIIRLEKKKKQETKNKQVLYGLLFQFTVVCEL